MKKNIRNIVLGTFLAYSPLACDDAQLHHDTSQDTEDTCPPVPIVPDGCPEIPVECSEGTISVERQILVDSCGINGRGTVAVSCVEGTPVYGSCVDSDVCRDGETRDTDFYDTSCGLNRRGIAVQESIETCVSGHWSSPSLPEDRTACFDSDECVDGTERTEVCGINNAGQQRQVCVEGLFVNDGSCLDDDLCRNAADYGSVSCGNEDSGNRSISCESGNLTFGECVGETEPAIGTGLEGKVLFSRGYSSNIYIGDASTLEVTNVTIIPRHEEFSPKWSPDKSKIAFTGYTDLTDTEVFVMNADGSDRINISNNSHSQNHYPTWHPDGTKVAFSDDGYYHIANLNTGEITNSPENIFELEWSRDGSKTVFVKFFGNTDDTINFTMEICSGDENFSESGMTRLTYSDSIYFQSNSEPSYSPDGRKILFVSNRDWYGDGYSSNDIYVMNADGTNQINLTNSPLLQEQNPVWSPGGSKIMFTSYDEEIRCIINVMDSDGTNVTSLPFRVGSYISYCNFWGGIDWKE